MLFKNKKTIISNPDEVVLNYMERPDQKHIKAINKADAAMLAKVLAHFDIQTVCKVLVVLSADKDQEVYAQFSEKRKNDVINRLPSQVAALLVKDVLHRV